MKIFASGSCRLIKAINNGYDKVEPLHSMFNNYYGINFCGKLHNIKQHIQFIQWLHDDIHIPPNILSAFLTSYGTVWGYDWGIEDRNLNYDKKQTIRTGFAECDFYLFEICSLKLFERDGFQVQYELTQDHTCTLQSEEDLYNDLSILISLLPQGKTIILQCHFRPNIIYDDDSKMVTNREIIYNTMNRFCTTKTNIYLYDPSVLLKTDTSLLDTDDIHFTTEGYAASFSYIYEKYMREL